MRKSKRWLGFALTAAMVATLGFSGCGKKSTETSETTAGETETTTVAEDETTTEAETVNESQYIELALNVYYNDSENSYYDNEVGSEVIKVYSAGQYSLTFDCDTDLSTEAKAAGVTSLTNLTAIYITDYGAQNGEQSPLKDCNIMYDSIVVDDTELTITMTEPKSAFKASGLFDTNDPINGWDGSCVEEVTQDTSNHVANFSTVTDPKKITITFSLTDLDWVGDSGDDSGSTSTGDGSGYTNTAVFSTVDFTDMNALEFTQYMGNGINLGNTMEACGDSLGKALSVSTYETYWGQPVTTAEMIQGMKDCGFDTLRIPVAWTNMMDYENGDLTINTDLLDRVEEIVNYALDAEMFVIVNDHYDSDWWTLFGDADEENVALAWDIYEAIWTQVSDRFKDYGDMLIFESANEELGDSLNESGLLSEDERYSLTAEINQKFVDIVRNSGGNNDDRFLLIAGYNTDFEKTCSDKYVMPTDTVDGKLIISVHYYTPWNYCGAEKDARWGLKSEMETMDELFATMTKFTDAGYGVIIGEYAALPYWVDGASFLKQNTTEFTKRVLDLCDIYNYVPVLWSCNDLYLKTDLTMASDELTELFTSRCYAEETAAGDSYIDDVKASMADDLENALEMWEDVEVYESGTPVAWIMWNGGAGTYSVGDTYNPADCTEGITATTVVVDGAGTYTVGLDFAGKNSGLTFAALAIADGELLYPGCIIEIKEIDVNGEPISLIATPYTSSDDEKCTRVNLVNEWVNKLPDDARNIEGDLTDAAPVIIDKSILTDVDNISITFELHTAE